MIKKAEKTPAGDAILMVPDVEDFLNSVYFVVRRNCTVEFWEKQRNDEDGYDFVKSFLMSSRNACKTALMSNAGAPPGGTGTGGTGTGVLRCCPKLIKLCDTGLTGGGGTGTGVLRCCPKLKKFCVTGEGTGTTRGMCGPGITCGVSLG